VRPDVEVKQVAIPQGEETYILCRTAGRKEKEKAIRKRFSLGMERALQALEEKHCQRPTEGSLQDGAQTGTDSGAAPASHDLFEVTLRDTPAGVRLLWEMKKDREAWRDLAGRRLHAAHNLQRGLAEQMWSMYMHSPKRRPRFVRSRVSFRFRPLFHQKESRVKAPHPGGLSRFMPCG